MALKTSVFVRNINNLSDARYCAGMGVDLLGFCIDSTLPNHVTPSKVKEIAGWVAGVKIAAEVDELNETTHNLIKETDPEVVLLNRVNGKTENLSIPVLLKVKININTPEQCEKIFSDNEQNVEGFLIENDEISDISLQKELVKDWCSKWKIFIGSGINNDNLEVILNTIAPTGISLKGGDEIKPGLKTFDELADILEYLEVD
ncbi:MAG: hypothetical protein ACK4ND_02790 [Cytophagaceae bacterium]